MKVQNPLIGRASQKFSNAIFQTWKGINVVRSKPLEVANPRSQGQTEQRDKFKAMVRLARLSLLTVKLGLKSLAIRQSEYNAFISQNILLQKANGSGIEYLDGQNLIYSKGSLSNISEITLSMGGTTLNSIWSNDNRPFSTPLDKVCIGVTYSLNVARDIVGYQEITRDILASAETYVNNSLPLPTGASAEQLIIFTYNDDNVSDNLAFINNV